MKRRGALGPDRIALIVLAIVGFGLAGLFLWGVFENKGLENRELCRLSILSRATVPSVAEDAVPLNCFTEKICITIDKGFFDFVNPSAIGGGEKTDCKQFVGESNVRTVEVKMDGNLENQKKTLDTIQREVANAMLDCWTMTGQGKLDIFTSGVSKEVSDKVINSIADGLDLSFEDVKPRCIVCSRVAFSDALLIADKELSGEGSGILDRIDYNTFLSEQRPTQGSLKYAELFTDESVGSGYGVVNPLEKLNVYAGRTDITDEEFEKLKQIISDSADSLSAEQLNYLKGIVETKQTLIAFLKQITKPQSSSQISVVFTQIKVSNTKPKDQFLSTLGSGALISTLGAFTSPGKFVFFFAGGPMGLLLKAAAVGAVSYGLASSAETTTRNNQALAATTCGEFTTAVKNIDGGDGQYGCSLVKLMKWDVNQINNLCTGGIEGNL